MNDILVLGGTGTTGRRVARHLRAAGEPVRIASRTAGAVRLDLADPTTWATALDGVAAAYLVEPDLRAASADPWARLPALVDAAVAAGVRRLVLLTASGADYAGHPLLPADRAVRDSGAAWTVLRPTWFAQNFSEGAWRADVRGGSLALPTGDGRTPFVDAEDIAAVAASALTDDRHAGEVYLLTGPRAIDFGEAVGLIAAATGRPVRHVDVDPEAHTEQQVAHGVPREVARMMTGILAAIGREQGDAVADGVERALGRPPRGFEDFVADAVAAGAWV